MQKTECENKWCIYYEEGRCTLVGISINSYGMCDDCIMIDPDETEMKMRRKREVDILDAREKNLEYRIEKRQRELKDDE